MPGLALKQNWLFLTDSSLESDWGGKLVIIADPMATAGSKDNAAKIQMTHECVKHTVTRIGVLEHLRVTASRMHD